MDIDGLDLDYRLLRLFLTIYDEGSVTAAANRLGVGQPTVSHGLDRLRQIVGDPLFVRSGRGITPTAHGDEMAGRVRIVLQDLRNLARVDGFDPHDPNQSARFVIGTNDYEVAVILPELIRIVRGYAADIRFKVFPIQGDAYVIERLRNGQLDLAIGLHMSENVGDIAQQTLFREHMSCFYDGGHHDVVPDTLDRYCAVPHARVIIGNNDHSAVDEALQAIGRQRKTVLQASTFASIASLIRGTDVIASLPSRLEHNVMAGFARCAFPFEFPQYSFAQSWHVRNAASAPHKWLRGEIFKISRRL